LGPFLLAAARSAGVLPNPPASLSYELNGVRLDCLRQPADSSNWDELIAAACPGALAELGLALDEQAVQTLFNDLGFYPSPSVPLDLHGQVMPASLPRPGEAATGQGGLLVSPLQMALAAAALSSGGQVPPAQLVLAIEDTTGGWLPQEATGRTGNPLSNAAAFSQAQRLAALNLPIWELSAHAYGLNGESYMWYLAGSLNSGSGPQRVVVVLLEEGNQYRARSIGRSLLLAALDS
jgi:hypothetical protein